MDATFFDNLARLALSQSPYPDPRFPPSPYYRFLKLLAGAIYPTLSVELGVCGGGGSFYLAQGWRPGQVVGVDCTIEYPQNIDFILTIMHNFTFYKGDSVTDAENIVATYGKPNIVFIDTIHTFERTVQEFEAWKPYLADKAVVCFDDLNRKEMSGFWEYVPRGNKVRLDNLHGGEGSGEGGFGVWWKE